MSDGRAGDGNIKARPTASLVAHLGLCHAGLLADRPCMCGS